MATLILGAVGRIVAGPIGAIVGTLLGGGIDHALVGGGRGREQGRISNPAVQSATYGEPIPLIVGMMRAAGNLIWTSGIVESSATAGGGKRSGPSTTTYRYSASFAVGLAGRPIVDVRRIWADGKLIRDAGGSFVAPITMRLHLGDPDQAADPLIAAAEGVASTPAYRGLAYAVFEGLPLADYGNRIPNLTFEIVADPDVSAIDTAITGIAVAAGVGGLAVSGQFPAVTGYIAARAGSLAEALAPLLAVSDAALVGDARLRVQGAGGDPLPLVDDAMNARLPNTANSPDRVRRAAADSQPSSLELAFYDTSRDYQPGLQRARRTAAMAVEQQSIAAAMSPAQAKSLAVQLLRVGKAAQTRRRVRLSWRHVGIAAGTLVTLGDDPGLWRVREARFENFIVYLEVERRPVNQSQLDPPGQAPLPMFASPEGGRALVALALPVGPTILHMLDLPPLPGDLPTGPRLWVAGNGSGEGWRRAEVEISTDGGDSFASAGSLEGGTVIGTVLTILPDADAAVWDLASTLDVELLADRDWIEPRSPAAVLAGANLALVGDELIQFSAADAIAPRRFRLHGLLRGRRGTEAAMTAHRAGERFVLIDAARMLAIDLPIDAIGRQGLARAAGAGDMAAEPLAFQVGGAALLPLSPVHLQARALDRDLHFAWVRRSRAGFGWANFVDAPLAEVSELYQVEIWIDGRLARRVQLVEAMFAYPENDRIADGGGRLVVCNVSQWSAAVGPGASASITIEI